MAAEKLRIGLIGTVPYFNHHFGRAIDAVPEMEAVAAAAAKLDRSDDYIQNSLGESLDEHVQKYGLALYEDPWEMDDLADDSACNTIRHHMMRLLHDWMRETQDRLRQPFEWTLAREKIDYE
jgi:hypothetical protein